MQVMSTQPIYLDMSARALSTPTTPPSRCFSTHHSRPYTEPAAVFPREAQMTATNQVAMSCRRQCTVSNCRNTFRTRFEGYFQACWAALDEAVRNISRALTEAGIIDNTIILVTTDMVPPTLISITRCATPTNKNETCGTIILCVFMCLGYVQLAPPWCQRYLMEGRHACSWGFCG